MFVATTAERASYGRTVGIAATASSSSSTVVEMIEAGVIPPSVTGLAAGTVSWVRASSTGTLERCTPGSGDDIVGKCHADGSLQFMPGTWDSANYAGGGGGGSTVDVPIAQRASIVTGSGTVSLRPCPPGHWNPVDYGAVFDGLTDDLWAFQAMHAAMPDTGGHVHLPLGDDPTANITTGMPWLSDTWRISKPITMRGSGGTGALRCGFEHAPGRIGISLDPATISLDGNTASGFNIGNFDCRTQHLVHPSYTGTTLGYGLKAYAADWGTTIRVGDLFVESGSSNPTRCYRATSMTANSGHGPGAFSGVPAWSTTLGSTVTSNGITWTTEAIPALRQDSHAYIVGERITTLADNRGVFTCTVAGTSAGSPPSGLSGDTAAVGLEQGGSYTDGTVTWRCDMIANVYVRAGIGTVSHIHGSGTYGSVVLCAGGTGQDVLGTTNADSVEIDDIRGSYVGLVCHVAGSDSNGFRITRLWGINVGSLMPTPDAVSSGNWLAAGGGGGHLLHDHSLASGSCSDGYVQTSTGRPVLKTGLGRLELSSMFQEIPGLSHASSVGYCMSLGGSLSWTTTSNVVHIDMTGGAGRGFTERDDTAASVVVAGLTVRGGSKAVFPFSVVDATRPDNIAWRYASGVATGWWGLSHGNQAFQVALAVAEAHAGEDPGPGWMCIPAGHLSGLTSGTPIFRGTLAAITDSSLRAGARKTGDQFSDSTTAITILENGYRAAPWVAATTAREATPTWGISATTVTPTASYAAREGGKQVWKCTTAGTTHATTEPTWPGSPTPGVTTQTDGTVTWTYVGASPAYDVEQRTAKARIPTRLVTTTTTTATASQVIHDGGTVNGVDLALPPSALVRVSDLVIVKKASTADGGSIEIKSDWVRNGTGAPAQLGASVITYNLSGTTLDATTVAHAANGNRIELKASPESADTLAWSVFRTQTEGVD